MNIPRRFERLLAKNKTLEAGVYRSIEELEIWIKAGGKRPTFFPDYTDHSLDHIEEVLATMSDIANKEASSVLGPADAAVLILAAILHDSAMHLSREGFESLIVGESSSMRIAAFDEQTWPELWTSFMSEVKRFDERKLREIIGDTNPPPNPDLKQLTLDDRTRRLIGEFIRRHHARLAHEVSRFGVPGADSADRICLHVPAEYADLAGLVARSHGHSLRAMLPYLKDVFSNRVHPHGVHAIFIMVLLRISDFLQIQASRAPDIALRIHRLQSPYSAVEWRVHAAILDVRESEEDPESLYIRALPNDLQAFLRLKGWLEGLQEELDHSWAVLGEIYGRREAPLQKLGIKIRRIRSNLDDLGTLANKLLFVPVNASLSTASASLLRLLIGPLYGDRPEIGIRELLQNAIDAVRERDDLEARRGMCEHALTSEAPVKLSFHDDGNRVLFVIEDRGVGMTPETISSYFLCAGASFRDSEAWQENFLDGSDRSRVLRSGRFGIGVLAAFLVGDEVKVSTRHFTASRGIRFTVAIGPDPVELTWCDRPIGTTITIAVKTSALDKLFPPRTGNIRRTVPDWDWYTLAYPEVTRFVSERPLAQAFSLPDAGAELPLGWRRIEAHPYEDVYWTYGEAPALTVNGLIVRRTESPFGERRERRGRDFFENSGDVFLPDRNPLPIRPPNVSIFDANGHFPLDLRREDIVALPEPFTSLLLEDVYEDFLTSELSKLPGEPWFAGDGAGWALGLTYKGVCSQYSRSGIVWGWLNGEHILLEASLIWEKSVRYIVGYPVERQSDKRAVLRHASRVHDTALVIPLPFSRHADNDKWAPENRFGSQALLEAYRRAFSDFLEQLTISWRAFGSPFSLSALRDSYDVRGVRLYTSTIARDELEFVFEGLQESLPDETVYDAGSADGRYVIECTGVPFLVSPTFAFRSGEEVFPIIELVVDRRADRPAESEVLRILETRVARARDVGPPSKFLS